jgi:hypothetical protein
VGLARLAASPLAGRIAAGRIAAGTLTAVLVVIAVTTWPPAASPDGGWPLADESASRVMATTGERPFALDGIPPFKSADAMRFPLERRGAPVLPEDARTLVAPDLVVLVCDPLFDEVVGAPCGGPAEDAWLGEGGRDDLVLLDRFEAGPRRVLSVYGAAGG